LTVTNWVSQATVEISRRINFLDIEVFVNRLGPDVVFRPDRGATFPTARVTTTRTVCSPPHLTVSVNSQSRAWNGG
jgi:hypothetical protein